MDNTAVSKVRSLEGQLAQAPEQTTEQIDELSQECSREEIRQPGSIQQHGFLVMLDVAGQHIIAASRNAEQFLDVPLKLLLGAALDTVFEREILGAIRALSISIENADLPTYLGAFRLKGELCNLVTHRIDGKRVLEFEQVDRLIIPEIMNAVITNFVGKLSKLDSTSELCQAITRQVKELTRFERVLLYSFDEAGHGTVLAEEREGSLPTYLDLRFPASDIPEQARKLYLSNTIRIIPDANYEPSPIVSLEPDSGRIDLTQSILRSVSPTHIEYMKNMGTLSSMSISIICDGKLWGLISGHHSRPHSVPYLVRSACDLLTKMVGTQLSSLKSASRLSRLVHFHSVHRSILTHIAAETNYLKALRGSLSELPHVTGASGVSVVLEDEIYSFGRTPDESEVGDLAKWLDKQEPTQLVETRQLSAKLPWTSRLNETASGLLAIRTSDVRRNYILWFRPEVVQEVTWAGEPIKSVDKHHRLHPRNSFESWKETVFGQSNPWTDVEIESALDFRAALTTISLKRAEEAAELSEARFQQLTHALPALIWASDDAGVLTYVNDRWREMGMPSSGIWYQAAFLHEDERSRVASEWSTAQQSGAAFEEEVRIRSRNGVDRWHLVRAVPFRVSGRQRAGWVGTFMDTTDRREREAALRMTEKLATTGRMTSVIAHEINNPLESITNLMYLLRSELGQNETARGYIGMAESELERISGITKQTLRWGRERTEQQEIVDASALFDDVLRLFAGKIRNRQVRVIRLDPPAIHFTAVGGQIRQVIANLVSNAVDAVPVGGQISLNAQDGPSGTTLTVSDLGIGMSEEEQKQLFQPFFSTKGDLGNGLGLYISQEIVERHAGKLLVESRRGVGTTIQVVLPKERNPERAVANT